MRVPSEDRCYELIDQMDMMSHIQAHSIQVCRVAMCIVDHLKRRPKTLSRDLIRAASLLHDITKTRSFTTGENHASTGGELLTNLGYPEVGQVIRQHVRLDAYFQSARVIEAEIVNYADKRVLHDRVVDLEERMAYVRKRYGKTRADKQRLKSLRGETETLEKRLFFHLPFSPDDLPHRMGR